MKAYPVLAKPNDCPGSGACYSICRTKTLKSVDSTNESAIKMVEDEEGFLYPVISSEFCVICGKCMQVCPMC